MSVITLTDRISVSVRAKNETERSSQSKATGANIQRALGGSGLSDADLEEIGNVDTITDEDGNEWIKMEDIIAAGRKMKEKGAFGPEYDEYVHNGFVVYRCNNISFHINERNYYPQGHPGYHYMDLFLTFAGDLFTTLKCDETNYDGSMPRNGSITGSVLTASSEGTCTENRIYTYIDPDDTYYGQSYTPSGYPKTSSPGGPGHYSTSGHDLSPNLYGRDNVPTLTRSLIDSLLNEEPVASHGGSLIDWDAPNAEVERQIKNLHDTWDVSDHAGAVTGNGTYVLAGPIEFNDGD